MVKKILCSVKISTTGSPIDLSIGSTGHVLNKNINSLNVKCPVVETFTFPIDDDELVCIYEKFIKPYIECEVYKMGSILDIIRINKIIDPQIENATNPKIKYILQILRHILTVLLNAQRDFINVERYKKEINVIREKYNKCQNEVYKLIRELDLLKGNEKLSFALSGGITLKTRKIKPLIYIQAKLDIDRAWYIYLHGDCKLDPDLYSSTITYVRSFGTRENAYNTLIELLDEKYTTFSEDIEKTFEENEENENNEENEENENNEENEQH